MAQDIIALLACGIRFAQGCFFCLQTKNLWFMNCLYLFVRTDSLLPPRPQIYLSYWYYFKLFKKKVLFLNLNLAVPLKPSVYVLFWDFRLLEECELWRLRLHGGAGLWYLRVDFELIRPFHGNLFFVSEFDIWHICLSCVRKCPYNILHLNCTYMLLHDITVVKRARLMWYLWDRCWYRY